MAKRSASRSKSPKRMSKSHKMRKSGSLAKMTVKQLRKKATKMNIEGRSKLNTRAKLIRRLSAKKM